MSSRNFNVSNFYKGLEEAVNTVLDESDSDGEYDFAVIPPEPSVVTDEEEGVDEDMVTATLPQDVPGNIEVFRANEDIIQSDDSSDDEPLAEKTKRRRQQLCQPVWRKCSPIYSSTTEERSDVQQRQEAVKEQLGELSPVHIFEKNLLYDNILYDNKLY